MGDKKISMEDAIKRKKDGIKKLNGLLESYINSNDEDKYKKAFNIASWIRAYSNYLHFESCFVPAKNIAYKRGDVVKVNFGYNLGNELGGIHYAVVIDKENKHRSGMLTIVPLSSRKNRVYERDIDLGNDLYKQLNNKLATLTQNASDELNDVHELMSLIKLAEDTDDSPQTEVLKIREKIIGKQEALYEKITLLEKMRHEIEGMKTGSIAKIEQITSISKMRIIDPKQTGNVLHNISLSATSMKLINARLKHLYIVEE